MHKKIYLTGRDFVSWATDDDYFFIKKAISSFASVTENIEEADVIHSINWYALMMIDKAILKNKPVISHIPHDVRHMLVRPEYLFVAPYIDWWIVPSSRAKEYADILSLQNLYVPYGIVTSVFYKIEDTSNIAGLKKKYNIPTDKYLIGSFQRDTEGADLKTPKYIKGPDLFLEIVKKVYQTNKQMHVIIAGPRRFWLKNRLKEEGIPYAFIGEDIEGRDDLTENTLDHKTINELYNLIDLYIVSSRMEGGPKAILECAAAQTKIISTDVGNASDILNSNQLYDNFITASSLVLNDIENNTLNKFLSGNHAKIPEHSLENITSVLSEFYGQITIGKAPRRTGLFKELKVIKKSWIEILLKWKSPLKKATIFFQFKKPPWGGGNQFLLALSNTLSKKGWQINNSLKSRARIFLFNSFHVTPENINIFRHNNKLILHRIDGPTFLIRGKDAELDDSIFSINNRIADISIFQSAWSFIETIKLGYYPSNPVLIVNASDPEVFNTIDKQPFSGKRKIRLISSSWSNNPRKGGSIYKWLDNNLDWERYEYNFIGRVSEKLLNIKTIDAVPSEKLANLLKEHDIYITASDNDPCSNAVIEALSCGLPVVYLNKGGHPELVQFGGVGFENKEDIPSILDSVINNYEQFQSLVLAPDIGNISDRYIKCMNMGAGY